MEHGLGDFQATDHAAGVLPHQPIGQVFERHEVKGARDTAFAFRAGYVVEAGGDGEVFLARERAIDGEHLGHVPNHAAHATGLPDNIEHGDRGRADA